MVASCPTLPYMYKFTTGKLDITGKILKAVLRLAPGTPEMYMRNRHIIRVYNNGGKIISWDGVAYIS